MMNLNRLNLQIIPQPSGSFFICLVENGAEPLIGDIWKQQLLMWHEESFYGSFVKNAEMNGRDGIELNSYELVTLLGNEHFSSFITWDWCEFGDALLAVSPIILEAIEQGHALPDFQEMAGESDQPFFWKVPQIVWDEFTDDYWQQSFFGENMREFMAHFYNRVATIFYQDGIHGKTLREKFAVLQNGLLSADELTAYFDESQWRKWIDREERLPFSIGLRLTEPEEDDKPWKLETILRDVKNPDKVLTLRQKSRMPKRWLPFLQEVYDEQAQWLKLFPWLSEQDELTSNLEETYAWEFLTDASGKLLALGIEILLPSWWEAMREANLAVKARLKQTSSNYRPSFVGLQAMLDFDWRLSMNGADLSEEEFQSLVNEQRKLVKIRGRWVKLDPKMVAHIQALMQQAKKEGLRMQDILAMREEEDDETETDEEEFDPRVFAQIQIELNQSMKKMLRQLHHLNEIPQVPVSSQLVGQLRPYQQLGLDWLIFLRQFGFGAILADDMGLGKTIQLIAYLLHVNEQEKPKQPALIICPTSVLGNWQKELERFAPHLQVYLHYGTNRDKGESFHQAIAHADIVLTSYGLSHLDYDEFSAIHWNTIAIDEAQNIKNADTKQSRAIRKFSGQHHIALTGTPMENRLSELWSIFDFVNHGYLGTFGQFQKRFIIPIEKDDSKKKIQELQQLIKPFLLRRTKKDPEVELNLPEKLEQKEYCQLTGEQAALYEDLVQDTFSKIESLSTFERKGLILQMLNRLKQLCNHPSLYLKEEMPDNITERSNKMAVLVQLADSIIESQEACLIFTQYIGMGTMIQSVLKERYDVSVPFLNGSMPKSKRDEYVSQFQQGAFPFFILSLKAGGTGLNLTAANHVIHYDRWWNPAVENQATDRAYRIGQNRFVHVHKLITTGTLEEKIDLMLEKKQALNDEIIRSDQWVTELSNDELLHLLALA